jgi:hypothetical protein
MPPIELMRADSVVDGPGVGIENGVGADEKTGPKSPRDASAAVATTRLAIRRPDRARIRYTGLIA